MSGGEGKEGGGREALHGGAGRREKARSSLGWRLAVPTNRPSLEKPFHPTLIPHLLAENFLPSDASFTTYQREARQRLHHLVVLTLLSAGFKVADLFGSCQGAKVLTGTSLPMDTLFAGAAGRGFLPQLPRGGPWLQDLFALEENAPLARRYVSFQVAHLVFGCNPAKFCQVSALLQGWGMQWW